MKNKLITIIIALLLLLSLTGCTLAKADGEASDSGDRLIGVFVTTEYLDLFDFDSYLQDNAGDLFDGNEISQADDSQYQGKLYAVLKKRELTDEETGEKSYVHEFVFDTVDGICYFSATMPESENEDSYVASGSDFRISDGHMAINVGDTEDSTTLEGTIYVTSEIAVQTSFYINPVYQSPDGSVYTVSGQGMSQSGDIGEGAKFTHTLNETTTVTENGKTKSVSTEVTLSIAVMYAPEKVTVTQMDENSAIISRTDYTPGELPEKLTLDRSTQYVIVETYKTDFQGNTVVSRELYSPDDSSMVTYYSMEDGICSACWTELSWSIN